MSWIKLGRVELNPPDYLKATITEPFIYKYTDGRIFGVPVGTLTDGASIPDILESIAGNNFQGSYVPAAFLHDYLCFVALTDKKPQCSWEDCHKIFYQAMLDNGCSKWGLKGAWVKYQAVKIGMFFRRWKY